MHRCESYPLVDKRSSVKVQPLIPVLHKYLAGYFSEAFLWEMMALTNGFTLQVVYHSLFIVCLVPDFHTWSDGPDLLAHQMAVMHVH